MNASGDVTAKELHAHPQPFSCNNSVPPWPDPEWRGRVPLLGNVPTAPSCTTFLSRAEESKSNLWGCRAFSGPQNEPPKVREGLWVVARSATFKLLRAEPLTLS